MLGGYPVLAGWNRQFQLPKIEPEVGLIFGTGSNAELTFHFEPDCRFHSCVEPEPRTEIPNTNMNIQV